MNTYTPLGILSAILFALLPFATSRHLFHAAINTKYFLIILAVLVMAGALAWWLWEGRHPFTLKNRPLLWAGLFVLGAYWLTAFSGIFPERSIFSDIQRSSGAFFITHIAVFAFLLGEFLRERDWALLRRTIALSAGIASFFTLLGAEGLGISGRLLWTNLDIHGFTFGNSTFAGTYLFLALVITLIELLKTPRSTRWFYALAGSALFIFFSPILLNVSVLWGATSPARVFADPMLLLGSARASSAAAILTLIFFGGYLLLRRYVPLYKKYALLAWGGLFAVAILGSTTLLFMPGSYVQEKYTEASTGARIVVWEGALQAFKERPLLGWGSENFEQALQGHFNSRLYEDEFIGEIWFDRAHNVVVDTLVSSGLLGALAHLLLVGAFVWVVYRAREKELLGEGEFMLLCALPLAHFLELQTGFDTVGSYVLLGFLGGYALSLERGMGAAGTGQQRVSPVQTAYYKAGAVALGLLILLSAYLTITELNRQYSLYRIFVETDTAKQSELIQTATSRPSSFESLRLASLSLVNGTLGRIAEKKADAQDIKEALAQLDIYEEKFRNYLKLQPNHYRARMDLAYLLSVKLILGGKNEIKNAKELVAQSYELSPGNLLTPAMDALLELYEGHLVAAKAKAEEIVALNPNAPFGKEVLAHIEKQEKTFPEITVFRFINL